MKSLLAFMFQLLIVDQAQACHKYSRWYYPYPQHCRIALSYVEKAYVPRKPMGDLAIYPPMDNPTRDYDMPLPNLDGQWLPSMDTSTELELLEEIQRFKALQLLKEHTNTPKD